MNAYSSTFTLPYIFIAQEQPYSLTFLMHVVWERLYRQENNGMCTMRPNGYATRMFILYNQLPAMVYCTTIDSVSKVM
jgi:hypothetical protein